jgi:hypothetical protein
MVALQASNLGPQATVAQSRIFDTLGCAMCKQIASLEDLVYQYKSVTPAEVPVIVGRMLDVVAEATLLRTTAPSLLSTVEAMYSSVRDALIDFFRTHLSRSYSVPLLPL